jgi:hypothetical protein
MKNKYVIYGLAFIVFFISQYFFHDYKVLLIISFLFGLLFYKSDINWLEFSLIELCVLITLILVNGLNTSVLNKFSIAIGNISPYALVALSLIVSILSVSLCARSGTLIFKLKK